MPPSTRLSASSFILLAAACTPSAPPRPGFDGEVIASEVRAASLALVEAMNAHTPDSILAFYALDDDFTYVGCTNFMFGPETFAGVVRGYHSANPEVRYDMAVQGVRVLGPDAAVVSLQGTSSPDLVLFTTRVVSRDDDGRWRVVWEHESWPGCPAPTAPHPGTVPEDTAGGAGTTP